jgi:hypothetical protein
VCRDSRALKHIKGVRSMLRLIEDRRVGGNLRLQLTEAPSLVQIPDEIRKCVAFVGVETASGNPVVLGTLFLVSVKIGADAFMTYGVTAAHVIDALRSHSPDGTAIIRLNNRDSGTILGVHQISEWHLHPDHAVDVAVMALPLHNYPPIDYRTFPLSAMATAEVIQREVIGIGDEVFVPGLFFRHYGTARNIPIVRAGNIAAMPEEPVATARGATSAYLIECRSIGGLSGSPVFVYVGQMRTGTIRASATFFLLGVMHGHWDVRTAELDDSLAADGLREEVVNMGIAIVMPAERISEVLDLPVLREPREAAAASVLAARAPTQDSASPTEPQQPD